MRNMLRVVKWGLLGCAILLVVFLFFSRHVIDLARGVGHLMERPIPLVFSGESNKLKQTIVIPTLDTPIIRGKNIVWCSTMQMAWNELKRNLTKGPVLLSKSQDVADRLNNSSVVSQDAPEGTWYVVAGLDVTEDVRRELAKRFPSMDMPELPFASLLAFAALEVNVAFRNCYTNFKSPLQFKSANGSGSSVRSFGIHRSDHNRLTRNQIKVWYNSSCYRTQRPEDFVIELSYGDPVQVIVARISLMDTLSQTVEEVTAIASEYDPERNEIVRRRLTEKTQQTVDDPAERQKQLESIGEFLAAPGFLDDDSIEVPATNWQLVHSFEELKGAELLNDPVKNLPIVAALQTIDFRLDRFGASLRSLSGIACAAMPPTPQEYIVDGPFMIMMKKRDCPRPFFVMWIDNAELLCPF